MTQLTTGMLLSAMYAEGIARRYYAKALEIYLAQYPQQPEQQPLNCFYAGLDAKKRKTILQNYPLELLHNFLLIKNAFIDIINLSKQCLLSVFLRECRPNHEVGFIYSQRRLMSQNTCVDSVVKMLYRLFRLLRFRMSRQLIQKVERMLD